MGLTQVRVLLSVCGYQERIFSILGTKNNSQMDQTAHFINRDVSFIHSKSVE